MNNKRLCIINAEIVLPFRTIKGNILVEDGKIAEIHEGLYLKASLKQGCTIVDAEGKYVMPGMIDIHSDAIEKEIQPRPNSLFPIKMAFYELEKKLAGNGITTMYHSLSLSDEWGVRDKEMVIEIIDSINMLKSLRSMINHRIHLRYELTYLDGVNVLDKLIRNKTIDFMSYMDHTPGQGQFKDPEELKRFTMQSYGKKEKDVEDFIGRTMEYQTRIDWSRLASLAGYARENGIRLASHDDDSEDKIDTLLSCNGTVSEFPINIEAAKYAKAKGLHVCVGAPNIVRGMSHSNNMRAMDAIKNDAADIICSDYLPGAMLPAVFKLTNEGLDIPEAVRMVTINPAKALGIDNEVGFIEVGMRADLIIVENDLGYPVVRKTLVGGDMVYQSDFHITVRERNVGVC